MTAALVAALSAPGLMLAGWLLRPVRLARDAAPEDVYGDSLCYGPDTAGLVD